MFKGTSFKVEKALNNNVVIAESVNGEEVIFIGKGIGFGIKIGEPFKVTTYDKVYSLITGEEQKNYLRLLRKESEQTLLIIYEAIEIIHDAIGFKLNESVHFALTQHLALALQRTKDNKGIQNPFLIETKWLYYETYQIAEKVVQFIRKQTNLNLPDAEKGFITLHIQSGIVESQSSLNNRSNLLIRCVNYIEEKINSPVLPDSIVFQRFVHQLKEVIQNPMIDKDDQFNLDMIFSLKKDEPVCYNIAQNLTRMIEKSAKVSISRFDIIQLILHLRILMEQQNRKHNSLTCN